MPGDVARGYEEPHFAAYVLRTALWALGSGELTGGVAAAARSLITRAWSYLENVHVASGPMAGTWSPDPATLHWYDVPWHAEIIITLDAAARADLAGDRGGAGDRRRHPARAAGRERRLDRGEHPAARVQ